MFAYTVAYSDFYMKRVQNILLSKQKTSYKTHLDLFMQNYVVTIHVGTYLTKALIFPQGRGTCTQNLTGTGRIPNFPRDPDTYTV